MGSYVWVFNGARPTHGSNILSSDLAGTILALIELVPVLLQLFTVVYSFLQFSLVGMTHKRHISDKYLLLNRTDAHEYRHYASLLKYLKNPLEA